MKIKFGFSTGINVGKVGVQRTDGVAAPTYSISGTVFDADGSTPVSGATVAIGAANTTSAANGTYSITGLAAGTNGSLTCTKSGYLWTAKTIAAMSGDLTGQNYTNTWYAVAGLLANVVGAYQAVGAASYAASKVNLANPGTNNLADAAGAVNWSTSSGWSGFAALTRALNTGLLPGPTWSVFAQYANATHNGNTLLGSYDGGTQNFLIQFYSATEDRFYNCNASPLTVSSVVASGNLAIVGKDGYRNGASVGTIAAGGSTMTTNTMYIGSNNAGGPTQHVTAQIGAVIVYNATPTAGQAALISSVMTSFSP